MDGILFDYYGGILFNYYLHIDGKFYTDYTAASNASPSTTAMAMITYLGSETGEATYGFTHGLALAMTDAKEGNTYKWKTSNTDAGHTKQTNSNNFTSESGLQYNATHETNEYPAFWEAIFNNGHSNPAGCSDWFLPTGYQWNQMINAAGNYATLRDGFTNAGGTNLQSNGYWSSTEKGNTEAWAYGFNGGGWSDDNKFTGHYVRSAIAF